VRSRGQRPFPGSSLCRLPELLPFDSIFQSSKVAYHAWNGTVGKGGNGANEFLICLRSEEIGVPHAFTL
jgi:hypothetical protein